MTEKSAPAKYFTGIITNREDLLDDIFRELEKKFGTVDFKSSWYPFAYTNFYEAEMGANLKRSFVSFEKLSPPESLPEAKVHCGAIEDIFRRDGNRQVNLDPGYIDYFKVVLASGKFGGHKVALSGGCWADFIMMYNKGTWRPMPWCFPDFAGGIYNRDLLEIRRSFKNARLSSREA